MSKGGEKGGESIIRSIDASLKVWVGNLPSSVEKPDVQAHFESAGQVQCTELMPRGTACIAYQSAEDAANAIALLNASSLGDQEIQVDVWETKGPPPAAKGVKPPGKAGSGKGPGVSPPWGVWAGGKAPGGKGFAATSVITPMFAKKGESWGSPAGGKGKGGGKERKKIDPSLKVWVGNVPESTSWSDLELHFKQAGQVTWAEVLRGGTAIVGYETVEDVATAIGMLNASEFGGQLLEVDTWTGGGGGKGRKGGY